MLVIGVCDEGPLKVVWGSVEAGCQPRSRPALLKSLEVCFGPNQLFPFVHQDCSRTILWKILSEMVSSKVASLLLAYFLWGLAKEGEED